MGFSRQEYWSQLPFPSGAKMQDKIPEKVQKRHSSGSNPWEGRTCPLKQGQGDGSRSCRVDSQLDMSPGTISEQTLRLSHRVQLTLLLFSGLVVSDSLWPHDYKSPGSSVHEYSQPRILAWVAISSPGDLPDPGIKPKSPALQADALISEPPEKKRQGPNQ